MQRIYHRYELWECYQNGMYEPSENESEAIDKAVSLLKDNKLFLKSGLQMLARWKITTAVHLSNDSSNKQAFIGQAVSSFLYNAPETATRKAWGLLTEKEQIEANHIADLIIKQYTKKDERKNRQLRIRLEL